MKLKNVIISIVTTLFLVFVSSCGIKKKTVVESPEWVISRPLSNVDYLGIGKSSKNKSPYSYVQLAKKNALEDISSEISVDISSSSVLSSVETPQGFVETYSSLIKSNTHNDIEGYELVATYETDTDYWCYYKLNKEKYNSLRQQKKQKAISKSLDFYKRCISFKNGGNIKPAIISNIKAIEAVKDYWNEDIEAIYNGENVLLGNELISNLNELFGNISVKAKYSSVDGVRGKAIAREYLSFVLYNSEGKSQEGIPVSFFYSESRLTKNKTSSSNKGGVFYSFDKLNSRKENTILTCKIDVDAIIDEASDDYLLHRLLDKVSVSYDKINISVRNPIFFISADEKILGKEKTSAKFSSILSKYLEEKGMKITSQRKESDFQIEIKSDTRSVSENSDRVYTSELTAAIKMISDGEVVYSTNLNKFFGRGSDYKSASINAYSKINNYTEVKVGNQIYRYIVD